MSAFVVTDNHISAILSFASLMRYSTTILLSTGEYSFKNPIDQPKLAQILLNENYRSVNFRYNNKSQPHQVQFHLTLSVTAPATVKYCECYDYQACETDNYEDTDAAKIIKHIKYEALRQALEMIPEYKNARWALN